jgi:hypothetical protein
MKTRGVIGKRIVRVRQQRFFDDYTGKMAIDVQAFYLEDGTALVFDPYPTETELGLNVIVIPPEAKTKRKDQ